jgi:TolB protein
MRSVRQLSAALLGLLCLSAAASATPPGQNGKLAFRRWFNPQHSWGAVFTANPDGSAVRQITHPRRLVADVEPDWSPDGTKILFQRIDVNGCGGGCETDEIDMVSNDGSHLVRLAYDPPGKGCIKAGSRPAGGICRAVPVWSPSGKQIAFQCQVQPSPADPGYSRVCLMGADGSDVRQLPQSPATGLDDRQPAWSPDGERIAFARGVKDQRAVFVMDADSCLSTLI